MLVKTNKEELKSALGVANLAVGSSEGSYVSHLKVDVDQEGMTLWSTDNNLFVSTDVECEEVEDPHSFTVKAKQLKNWIQNIPDGPITITGDDGKIEMRQNDIVSKFVSYDLQAFPDLERRVEDRSELFEIEAAPLTDALNFVEPFIADPDPGNPNRHELQVAELWDDQMVSTNVQVVTVVEDQRLADTVSLTDSDLDFLESETGQVPPFVEEKESPRNQMFRYLEANFDGNASSSCPLIESYGAGELSPFRIAKDDVKPFRSFLKKTEGEYASVGKSGSAYTVVAEDGSVFGFSESHYQLPDILPKLNFESDDPQVWEADPSDLKRGIAALRATAPEDNATDIKATLTGEGDGAELEMRMVTVMKDDESVYPVSVDRLEGSGDQTLVVGDGRLATIVGNFKGDIECELNSSEEHLRLSSKRDDQVRTGYLSLTKW